MEHAQRTGLQYAAELGGAALLFVATMAVREPLARFEPATTAAIVLALPIVPLWLMFAAIWRHYLRVDEYQRLQFLKASTLASGIGLFALASLPFLKSFGVPPDAGGVIWFVVPAGWVVALVVIQLNRGR